MISVKKRYPALGRHGRSTGRLLLQAAIILPGILFCLPVLLLITGSLIGEGELGRMIAPVFMKTKEFVSWKWIADYPDLSGYGRLLFMSPSFFVLFWNSMKMTFIILAGQIIVGLPAAWGFAVYEFKLKRLIFTLYIVLMLLPFQVTMLSQYLVLNKLRLLDTQWAVVIPAIFSTLPIFIVYGGFRGIPEELLEAARMDGAGEFFIFVKIGMVLGKGGILAALVLGFLEYWNMMEQPLAFLQDKALWPLSLYLPEISWTQAGFAFCAAVMTLIPAAFVFFMGQDYLEQGIIYAGLKE